MTTPAPISPRLPAPFARLALGALLLLGLSASAAPGAEALRWKFEKGKTYNYTVTQKMGNKTDANGQIIATATTQTMSMVWDVKDVDSAGVAVMDQTIQRILFEVQGPQGKVTVDTASKEEAQGPVAQIKALFSSLVGSPIRLKMSPRGEISDVTIDPKMIEGLKTMATGPLGEMFSEKGIKQMTTQATLILPEKAIEKGAGWNDVKKVEMPFGVMSMDNKYTLEGPSDGVEKIGVVVDVAISPKPDAPFEIKIASQDVKGAYTFDNKGGFLKTSKVNQKMQMRITVQNQEVVQDLENVVTMELGAPKK